MHPFHRSQVATLRHRLAEPPRRLIAVFGPRQTGKTTIVRQALARIDLESLYRDVDARDSPSAPGPPGVTYPVSHVRDVDWIVRNWEEARGMAGRRGRGSVLVFDEIQKIPGWPEAVKGLWDADRAAGCPLHVVILGSAPLLMQSGLNESLAGRFEPIGVTHWSFAEMSKAFGFSLPQYLYLGGFPGAAPLAPDPDRWREYVLRGLVEPNIERDILSMTRVDKPALLRQLFELAAAYSGQILSYNKMLGQLQDAGNTTTLARYLHLLSSAGLVAGLPKFSNKPRLVRSSSPKLNVLNTALMTAGAGYSFAGAEADRTFWGRLAESAVGAHLFNTAPADVRLHYWRSGAREVDFVLVRGRRAIPIEVTVSRRPHSLSGMEAFRREFSPPRSLLVGEAGIPLNEFLTVPAHEWFEGP